MHLLNKKTRGKITTIGETPTMTIEELSFGAGCDSPPAVKRQTTADKPASRKMRLKRFQSVADGNLAKISSP